jgi:hypothetical protein
MIYRGRYDSSSFDLICGERHDTLARVDGGLRLKRRLVLLDHTTLGTPNLAFFF